MATIAGHRSASMDLELLRAACRHAAKEKVIASAPNVWLPPKSELHQRSLTTSEVVKLLLSSLLSMALQLRSGKLTVPCRCRDKQTTGRSCDFDEPCR